MLEQTQIKESLSAATVARKSKPLWPQVLSRVLAAIVGGYALTYCVTAFLAVYLPMSPVDNVFVSGMLAFAVYTALVIYAFAASRHERVWLHYSLSVVVLAGLAFLPGGG
ncbi:MAG TPA: DUF3649 domain-containing protein [Gammaproteobacteria bacterium]|jgi:hypothetical protein